MAPKKWAVVSILTVAAGAWADAGELRISHSPRPCVVSGQFVRIEAQVEPASDEARARVLFRAEGEARFYAVPMRREGELFVGVLPSPAPGTARIAYFIAAEAGALRARAPVSSAYLADVVEAPCAEGAFAASATGPSELSVPRGAPQAPPGFERGGIGAFVEADDDALPPAAPARATRVAPLGVVPIPIGSRVRAVTSPGQQQHEGRLASLDGEMLTLETKGTPVRIPRDRLVSLEVREKGSSGMRALGGLAGGVAGLAVTLLACASSDACDSVAIAWAGMGLGAAAGVALTGGGSWKPVTLASSGRVALDLRPVRAGAAVDLRVGF